MAPLNPFPARPAARPTNQAQQDRGQQGGWPSPDASQQQPAWPQPQAQGRVNQGYPNAGYPQDYAAHAQPQPGPQLGDPYAPQFEPYSPAQRYNPQGGYGTAPASGYPAAPVGGYQPTSGYGQPQPQAQPQMQPQAQQYGGAQQQPHGYGAQTQWADPHGFDVGAFGAAAYANETASHAYDTKGQQDWHHHEAAAGYAQQDGYQQQGGEFGFAQPSGGELDPGYGEDEEYEYEDSEPRRGPRFMMMAAALAGAIVVGGGMAYGYRALFGSGTDGEPPVVKSASAPSKIKPADAGGMQFDHAERKIMSRLGEGSAAAGGAASSAQAASDESGTRKVSTLVVGRDGSIQAPPASPATGVPGTSVSVPGMTVVDAFGSAGRAAAATPPAAAPTPPAPVADKKVVVSPPAAEAPADKPITVTKVNAAPPPAAPAATASLADGEPEVETPKPAKKVKVAAANPDDAFSPAAAAAKPAASSSGINGYVAVLASIPRSDSSRMDALKRFADLQQKYGSILAGKTPDVAEANLGAKGNYHRLVVGPPGSREKASTLCSQLKAEGFGDCWVTGY